MLLGQRHDRQDLVEGGQRLTDAVKAALAAGERTPEIRGRLGTEAFGEAARGRLH